MSALSLVFRVVLFYTFISFSECQVQWYDAVNVCRQQEQILLPEITSNMSFLGYRSDVTMWTSSYILSVNFFKHTALYVEQLPMTEVHRGLCVDKNGYSEVVVLDVPYNYTTQDFKCRWDHRGSGSYHDSLLNITNLTVVREVLELMNVGQKYWISDISESVYSLVHQCEVFHHVANSTSTRKSYSAMRYCNEMNSYKCIDGKKYRTAVSLVKYLYDRHERNQDQAGIANSGEFVWKVSSLTLSGGIILTGLLVICLKIMRTFGSFKKEKRQVSERRFKEPVYDDDWVQMKQTASLKHDTTVLPSGTALSANNQDTRTLRKSNTTVIQEGEGLVPLKR